jgi:hypothetical protein
VQIAVGASNTVGSSKSLQFSAAGADYLSETPGGAGNGGTTTLSFWFKRSRNLSQMRLFSTAAGGVETEVIARRERRASGRGVEGGVRTAAISTRR